MSLPLPDTGYTPYELLGRAAALLKRVPPRGRGRQIDNDIRDWIDRYETYIDSGRTTGTEPGPCVYCGDVATDTIPDPNRQPGDPDRGRVPVCEFCFPAELLSTESFSLTKNGGVL